MLEKHKDGFEAGARLSILGNERMWFEKGSHLYQVCLALMKLHGDWEVTTIFIGKPSCSYHASKDYVQGNYEVIPLMLYGMAVECWLKGLLIMAMPRKSDVTYAQAQKRLDELMVISVGTEDHYMDALLSAIENPDVSDLLKLVDDQRAVENISRETKVRQHSKHRLVALYEEALNVTLAGEIREWIDRLESFIMMGRYPSLFVNKGTLYPWFGLLGRSDLFEATNDAIYARYEQLLCNNL